ncbi:Fibronectin type III domain protein [Halorubrum aidingense JCM 13560]|uniref:Fibronectin type III domain protein n=1 Tax=Halorubrum aidingense JCM 13560 TaxID=1230454 RepID=M0PGW2_9EURY|nr:Fibronectin type III domain protein [Halorubrum aidingense JCM 13560]
MLRAESSGSDPADYTAVATPSASLYTDTDLEDGEQYYYRVRAIYSGTPSQPTGEVDATTPLPSPTIDTLDTTTAREISVEYTLPDDSTDGDLTIERSEDDGATWTTIATVTDLSATTYTDTGLLDGEEYTYRLTRDTGDASAESIDSAITDLPAPTVLAPDAAGDTHLGVSWDATHNNGDTRVEYREDDSGDWVTHTTVARDTEQATVDGLLNGQLYGIRVVAETDHAESEDQ